MTASNILRIFALLSIWFFLTACDHGSKQAFADSVRNAGHFEKK